MVPGLPKAPGSADDGSLQPTQQPGVTRTVAENETVQGQLKGMLAAGSPVLEQARAKAERQAAARGLQNTSMAAEAGTSALLSRAIEIATADANVYGTAARDNQAVLNAAMTANQTALNQFASQRLASKLQIDQTQVQGQVDLLKLTHQGNIEAGLVQLKNVMEIERAALDNKTKLLMQGNDSVKGLFMQTQQNITNIMMNKDLDAAAKDRAVTEQLNMMRASMALVGTLAGDINLTGLLDQILGPSKAPTPTPAPAPAPSSPPLPPGRNPDLITRPDDGTSPGATGGGQ